MTAILSSKTDFAPPMLGLTGLCRGAVEYVCRIPDVGMPGDRGRIYMAMRSSREYLRSVEINVRRKMTRSRLHIIRQRVVASWPVALSILIHFGLLLFILRAVPLGLHATWSMLSSRQEEARAIKVTKARSSPCQTCRWRKFLCLTHRPTAGDRQRGDD